MKTLPQILLKVGLFSLLLKMFASTVVASSLGLKSSDANSLNSRNVEVYTSVSRNGLVIIPPTVINTTLTSQQNPNGNYSVTVPSTAFGGTDPDGTITNIRIKTFPTNATSITINGTLYTVSTFPGVGVLIPANASGQPTQIILVDPIDGAVTSSLTYATLDNLGESSVTDGNVNLPFSSPVAFPCSNVGYVVKQITGPTRSNLHTYDLNTGVIISTIDLGVFVNAMGYNPKDNMLWCVTTAGILSRIDANGVLTPFSVPNLVLGTNVNAGTFTTDGYFIVQKSPVPANQEYYVVDLDPARSTYLKIVDPSNAFAVATAPYSKTASTNFIGVSDFAFNPLDGLLYTLNGSGNITTLNYLTGLISVGAAPLLPNETQIGTGVYGTSFCDANGKLYVLRNANGAFYSVDIVNNKAVLLGASGATSNSDGANCVTSVLGYTIAGNIFNDTNGLKDLPSGIVNGTAYSATNLYAILYNNATNKVAAVAQVEANGSYALGADAGVNFSVYLTKNTTTVGSTLPIKEPQTGWAYTGEFIGISSGNDGLIDGVLNLGIVTADVSNVNFGVEQFPNQVGSGSNPANNEYNTQIVVPANTFTNIQNSVDATAVTGIRIIAFPTNVLSIIINNVTYTNTPASVAALSGLIIPTDANGNPTQSITVNPDASANVVISFKAVDAAGQESLSTGTASLLISNTPPVSNPAVANCVANPGGSLEVTAPLITGYDFEDGIYDGTSATNNVFVITAMGANGTLFYDGQELQVGDVVVNYDISLLTVNPDDNISSFSFSYTHVDSENITANTASTATINFASPAPMPSTTLQSFCATPYYTLANLAISGTDIKWYADAITSTALPVTTLLTNGSTYYATQTISGNCESVRVAITIELKNCARINPALRVRASK